SEDWLTYRSMDEGAAMPMSRGIRKVLATAVAVGGCTTLAAGARAGGLFAGDAGAQAQERAGAFAAKADDPSALMHNPAGLVKAKRYEVYIGANVVGYSQSF